MAVDTQNAGTPPALTAADVARFTITQLRTETAGGIQLQPEVRLFTLSQVSRNGSTGTLTITGGNVTGFSKPT
jgi:hypothetical protein